MTDPQSLVERLAGEAGMHVCDWHQDPPHVRGYGPASPEVLAKFAELVARECAQVCEERTGIDAAPIKNFYWFDCSAAIRQRFGVGE
mgnify:CR=1 FL=1